MKLSLPQIALLCVMALGAALLGVYLGYALGSRPNAIGFSIGAPPEPIARMANVDLFGITVLTTNGNYYACRESGFGKGAACWERGGLASKDSETGSDYSLIDQAVFAPPPAPVRELRTANFSANMSGAIQVTRYALLEDGTVWVWQAQANALWNPGQSVDQFLGAAVGLCCGGSAGLLFAVLLGAFFWFTAKKQSA